MTMSTGEFNTGDFYGNISDNAVIKAFAMIFLIGLVILTTITMINLLVAAIINDYQTMKDSVDMENLYFITEYIIEVGEIRRSMYHIFQKYNKIKILIPIYNTFIDLYDSFVSLCVKPCLNHGGKSYPKNGDIEENMKKITYCPHLICNSDECKMYPLPIAKPGWSYNKTMEAGEREPLLLRLLEIRKGNKKPNKENEEEILCYYHTYGLLWSEDLKTCTVDDPKKTTLTIGDDLTLDEDNKTVPQCED